MKLLLHSTDDETEGQISLVVGNLKPDGEAIHTNGNKSVQQQLPIISETEVHNTESVTLQPEKSHGPDDVNIQGEMIIDHPVFPSNLDEPNVPMTPLSQSSHIQLPTTKSRHSSTSISTGRCDGVMFLVNVKVPNLLMNIFTYVAKASNQSTTCNIHPST